MICFTNRSRLRDAEDTLESLKRTAVASGQPLEEGQVATQTRSCQTLSWNDLVAAEKTKDDLESLASAPAPEENGRLSRLAMRRGADSLVDSPPEMVSQMIKATVRNCEHGWKNSENHGNDS
jgi:hypothetical protein